MTERPEVRTQTRSRILDAGVGLWAEQEPHVLFGGLSVARVAQAAGVTRSTFYSYWPSTESFLADLADHLVELDAMDYPGLVSANGTAPYPPEPTTDLPRKIIDDCSAHLQVAVDDPTLGVRLGLLSKVDDPHVGAALRQLYRRAELAQYATFALSLEAWNREIRPPFDEHSIQIVFSALLEGLTLRHRVDPDRIPMDLYGLALLPLLMFLTRRTDDDRDVLELTDSINSWAAAGMAERLRERGRRIDTSASENVRGSMREVTISVRRLLARIGFGELSLADVAVATGYSELSLQQMFGSAPGIALCILFLNCHERYTSECSGLHGMERLRKLIEINRSELDRNPAVAQNMLLVLSGHTARPRLDLVDFDPRPIVTQACAEAIAAGELRSDLDAGDLAEVIQRSLLLEGSHLSAMSSSIDTVDLILRGAGADTTEPTPDRNGSRSR